jgi:hypothetical protein
MTRQRGGVKVGSPVSSREAALLCCGGILAAEAVAMQWQSRQDRQRGLAWPAVAVMMAAMLAAVIASAADRGAQRPRRRAAAPPTFDKATTGTFFDDAFGTLHGPRPAFATGSAAPRAAAGQNEAAGAVANGIAWSQLISEETLTDEVKDRKADVAGAVAKSSDFKGGGYDAAREAFSSVALAFGVIAAYDRDIRWKKDAATARDLFARAGVNCKVGTDQSFAESKARLDDLEALLEGGSPQGKPDRDEDFRWSQVAARPALMNRLERGEGVIGAGLASRGDFERGLDRILHDAEIVAAIAAAIQQPDFEYHDDDTYRGYAGAMRDAALEVRDACREQDYEAARAAASALKKSCDACHGDYRS